MPTLKDYRQFEGQHYETGPIYNALAYQGVKAPHTGKPMSEALMMGISGGVAFGYFTFAYEGYDPHVVLITRNTFNPMETLFDRLALQRDVLQTSKPDVAMKNVTETLENGSVPLVWADQFTLPYRLLPEDERMWSMQPIVVYGVEGDKVSIADGSCRPLTVSVDELIRSRAVVKDDKYRVMVLGAPDMDKLPGAVQKGIWQAISLYTEAPPKGKRDNFGFAALQHWADMLTNARNKQSWERFFPPGGKMFTAVAGNSVQPGAFGWIRTWGAGDGAERGLYADYLDEAAVILQKPALSDVAQIWRRAADTWNALSEDLLPDDVPLFAETKALKLQKHALFRERGQDALDEIRAINERLNAIRGEVDAAFPWSDAEAAARRAQWRDSVLQIHDIEREAVSALQEAMG